MFLLFGEEYEHKFNDICFDRISDASKKSIEIDKFISYFTHYIYRMEKLLVVLLVASATVCFLTNLLVLVILTKRRKRRSISKNIKSGRQNQEMNNGNTRWNPVNTFRYQIVTSQCFAGIVASAVVIYPLKVFFKLDWIIFFGSWYYEILSKIKVLQYVYISCI